ncbi:unnamed protein product [Choristocarpus tenellus]
MTLATEDHWNVIALLMGRTVIDQAGRGFILEALGFITHRGLLARHNVYLIHGLLTRFVEGKYGNARPDFTWTLQAASLMEVLSLNLLKDLTEEFLLDDERSGSEEREGVESLWLATVHTVRGMVEHASPRVSKAMSETLQRLVIQANNIGFEIRGRAFREELIKLPLSLVVVGGRASDGMGQGVTTESGEVCLRCCTLLSRLFLHELPVLTSLPDFGNLWLEVLRLLGSNLLQCPPGDMVYDSCQQIITNMVMVMAHSGLLGPEVEAGYLTSGGDASAGEGRDKSLLELTWEVLDPLCPSITPLLSSLAQGHRRTRSVRTGEAGGQGARRPNTQPGQGNELAGRQDAEGNAKEGQGRRSNLNQVPSIKDRHQQSRAGNQSRTGPTVDSKARDWLSDRNPPSDIVDQKKSSVPGGRTLTV